MHTRALTALVGAALLCAIAAPRAPHEPPRFDHAPATSVGPAADVAAGVRVLVDVADDLSRAEREAFVATLPGTASLNSMYSAEEGLYAVWVQGADAAQSLLVALRGDARVEHVEVDAAYEHYAAPNDPLYPFQWNFEQARIEPAWAAARGRGVVVAVIDTGVAYADTPDRRLTRVRDLAGTSLAKGYDFVDDDDAPFDEHGHGTHVAGTIAQTTGNSYGVAGVAPEATIMPIRVLDASGRGNTADIAEAIRFAADNGAHVINMSLGGPVPSPVMRDAVAYARRKGVLVVAAAGNNGWALPSYPAAYAGVFSVAATQYDRTTTFYSNHGGSIDIAAPGGNTRVDQNDDGRPDGILQETLRRENPAAHEFALYMGTSMASPHVAGVAALVRSAGVTRPDAVEAVLRRSASRDVPSYSRDRYGSGLLDADAALRAVATGYTAPRGLLAVVLAWAAMQLAAASGRRRPLRLGTVTAAAFLGATGVAVLSWGASLLHVHLPLSLPASAPLRWPGVGVLGDGFWLLSAAPVVAVYAAAGHLRERGASVVLGVMAAMVATLLAAALAGEVDVRGIPGMGALDTLWLTLNGAVGAIIVAAAARAR